MRAVLDYNASDPLQRAEVVRGIVSGSVYFKLCGTWYFFNPYVGDGVVEECVYEPDLVAGYYKSVPPGTVISLIAD